MRAIVTFLCLLNGGYMLADGVVVLTFGKFIGPDKPGPWSLIFSAMGVDPKSLGPLFVGFGIAWLAAAIAFTTQRSWAWRLGLILAVLTMWYFPFGTLTSAIVFVLILSVRREVRG